MAIRPAVDVDIPAILAHLEHLPNPPYQEDVAGLLANPNEHIWVDDALDLVCRIAAMPDKQELIVVWLFPRAAWLNDNLLELGRLLGTVLVDLAPRYPGSWRISATFQGGKNAKGIDDGGKELCQTWRDRVFRINAARRALTRDRGDGTWEISWTLAEAASRAKGLL